jgi:hypothetical protein
MTETEVLKEIEDLDKRIDLLTLALNSAVYQRSIKFGELDRVRTAPEKSTAKGKGGYYNLDVERPEGNWKGKEHN